MASRNYLKHTVSDTQPSGAALGDEWYQPASNILYKCVATNGTSVTFVPVATTPNNNLSVTGSIQGTQVIASNFIGAPTGGTALLPTFSTSGDTDTGIYFPASDTIGFVEGGTEAMRINSDGTISLGAAPGSESLRVTPVVSAVNYWNFYGSTTGNSIAMYATGTDTNIPIIYISKGTGSQVFYTNGPTSPVPQFNIVHTASAVNYLQATGGSLNNGVTLSAQGTDTNINLFLTPKGTGGAVFPAGAVGTPSITTTGDTNTGIYFPAADQVGISTGGAVRLTTTTTQFTATLPWCGQNGTVSAPAISASADTNTGIYFPAADTIAFSEGGVEAMRIDASGNVGIGTTSPTLPLNIGTSTLPAGVTIGGQMISSDVAALTPLLSLRRSAASGNPIFAQFTSSGTAASPTAVAINRSLGRNDWWGFDGTNYINAAAIVCSSDGAVSTGVVPGRLVFATSTTNTPVEAMRITSAGNVGIGISTPGGKLNVVGDVLSDTYLNANGSFYFQARKARGTVTTPLIITSSDVIGGLLGQSYTGSGWLTGAKLEFRVDGTVTTTSIPTALTLFTGDGPTTTERMRISPAGQVYIGTTTNPTTNSTGSINMLANVGDGFNIKHTINGNNTFNIWQTGTTTYSAIAFYKGDTQTSVGGIACTTTGTAYNTSSDYRLKENVASMVGALAKIAQLKPVTYTWKLDGSAGQGFIAHELQAVVPDAVSGEKDEVYSNGNPKYQGVDTSFLVATLVAAIQEQQALITQLQIDVAELKGKN